MKWFSPRVGIVNLFVKWKMLMSYKEKNDEKTMRSGEVCWLYDLLDSSDLMPLLESTL